MGILPEGIDLSGITKWLSSSTGQIMSFVAWGLLGIIVLIIFYAIWLFIEHNIKCDIYPLYCTNVQGTYKLGKKKHNRFKWNKKRTGWKPLFPLFNKDEIKPFENIYLGNRIYAFELEKKLIPTKLEEVEKLITISDDIRISIKKEEIMPIPYEIRNWQSLTHKKHEIEFADQTFWEMNKQLMLIIGVSIICLVMVIGTVYLTFKYAGGGVKAMDTLTSALNNFNIGGGGAP